MQADERETQSSNPYRAPTASDAADRVPSFDPNRFSLPRRSMAFYLVFALSPVLVELLSRRYRISTVTLGRYVLGVFALALVFLALQGVLAAVIRGEHAQKIARRVAGRCYLLVGSIGMACTAALLLDVLQRLVASW